MSLILLRSFTTKDTKDTKERREKASLFVLFVLVVLFVVNSTPTIKRRSPEDFLVP